MLLLWVITPIDAGSINNHLLETPAYVRTLIVLANLLDQDEDEDTQYILHKKFIYGSLAIAVVAKAAYRDLLRTIIVVQKRKDIQKDAWQSL